MDDVGSPRISTGGSGRRACSPALSRHLPDQAILSSDSGTAADWYARHIRIRRGMKASLSGNLATMVPGVPYGMAAKFAFPDRVSVAMVGDGAMQMGGMAEMLTAAKYYKTWADPRYVVVVLNNEDLNQVTWEQRAMEGDPRFDASQSIPYVSYADWADLIGLKGIKVTRSDQIEAAFTEAFAADRPVIVDALTTPDEPPMPPHVTFKQARALMTSVENDPDRGSGRGQRGSTRDGPRVPAPRERLSMRRHAASITHAESLGGVTHVIDRAFADVAHGRFERSLSGLTAFAAAVTTSEIYIEHYKASFGNKMMWSPIIVTPPLVVAGVAGVFSKKWAKTALPVAAAIYTLNGLVGEYFHIRGVARKPGGFRLASYNLPMGPPISAPGLMSIVGGMGLLAALLRRED